MFVHPQDHLDQTSKSPKKNKRLKTLGTSKKKHTHTEEKVFLERRPPPTQKKSNYKSTGEKNLAGLGDLFLVDGLSELTLS